MIDRLKLTNFTVFGNCEIDFSSKINVIVGENGTGKTHLLKAIYALCEWNGNFDPESKPKKAELGRAFTDTMLGTFFPSDRALADLRRRDAKGKSTLKATFDSGRSTEFSFGPSSKAAALQGQAKALPKYQRPLFIPAKEMLSFLDGIADKGSDRATVERLFDDACLSLCEQLLVKTRAFKANELENDPRIGTLIPALSNAIGGQFRLDRDRMSFVRGGYQEKKEARDVPSPADEDGVSSSAPQLGAAYETVFVQEKGETFRGIMLAEGYRKIGVLQQLLLNRNFVPGRGGPLLWDEPEANMNPSLMRKLVQIILEMSRNGQQVILATHDFVLMKWFDLLSEKSLGDNVRFHSLYRDSDTNEVSVNSTNDYLELSPNSIDSAFADLTDAEIGKTMGGLGK